MSLSPRHELGSQPIPDHPYRDSALLHGALAVVILVLSAIGGTSALKAVLIAGGYFAAATAWTWWRYHERIKAHAAAEARAAEGTDQA